jgi:hypothetical protein
MGLEPTTFCMAIKRAVAGQSAVFVLTGVVDAQSSEPDTVAPDPPSVATERPRSSGLTTTPCDLQGFSWAILGSNQ